ncbi:MAG: shikimate kinase [Bacteriovoracia bacterium]
MAKCEKILVAGFSGSGKSSFLKEIEKSVPDSNWTFNDLDLLLLKKHKSQEIACLIEEHGWEKFRLWERQTLESWLKEEGKAVLSLGGGSLSQMIFDLYKGSSKVRFCYLHAPFEDCWERLNLEGAEERPLVKLGKGELHRIYEERLKIFKQISWKIENPKKTDLSLLARHFWEQVSLS